MPISEQTIKLPSALQKIPAMPSIPSNSHIWIKRDDLIHPIVSGNKARKLTLFLEQIKHNKPARILSMGGNRSNFLHALAYICYTHNITLHALIRGHQPRQFDKTLQDLQQWGTQLSFIDKETFRSFRENPDTGIQKAKTIDAIWLPEGGSNSDAVSGIIKAVDELDIVPDQIFVPVGTGCTALGLALGCKQKNWQTTVIGIVVLKGALTLENSLQKLAVDAGYTYPDNLILDHNFCGSGFGKITKEIKVQQEKYEQDFGIALEPVYSIKTLNAFTSYCDNNTIADCVIIWHTGGLQGN